MDGLGFLGIILNPGDIRRLMAHRHEAIHSVGYSIQPAKTTVQDDAIRQVRKKSPGSSVPTPRVPAISSGLGIGFPAAGTLPTAYDINLAWWMAVPVQLPES